MSDPKPVTVRASTVGEVTERQQEGLDSVVVYLANALIPGIMLPDTSRIIVEWGDEEGLAKINDDEEDALGQYHLVEFGEEAWSLQHPAKCRREGLLLDCPVNAAVRRSRLLYSGRYYVSLDKSGVLVVGGRPE